MFETWKADQLEWWRSAYNYELLYQVPAYLKFIKRWEIDFRGKDVIEVAVGAMGGMSMFHWKEIKRLVYLDIIMTDLWALELHPPCNRDIELVDASFQSIPFKDNEFDLLVAYNSLDHGTNWREALDECFRVAQEVYINTDCRDEGNDNHIPVNYDEIREYAESRGAKTRPYKGFDNKYRSAIEIGRRSC